jgi:hypothetical protein
MPVRIFILSFIILVIAAPHSDAQRFYTDLYEQCQQLEKATPAIAPERRDTLMLIGDTLLTMIRSRGHAEILFTGITDGSLTQLAQIWFYTALHYHKIKNIRVFSGGLRPDALNYRIVAALKRSGFTIMPVRGFSNNPVYFFNLGRNFPDYTIFAKSIDYHSNPHDAYLVVPVNPQVDHLDYAQYGAACVIPYHWKRPDIWDDTQVEAMKYDEYSREIGRDMFFLSDYLSRKMKAMEKEKKTSGKKKRKRAS